MAAAAEAGSSAGPEAAARGGRTRGSAPPALGTGRGPPLDAGTAALRSRHGRAGKGRRPNTCPACPAASAGSGAEPHDSFNHQNYPINSLGYCQPCCRGIRGLSTTALVTSGAKCKFCTFACRASGVRPAPSIRVTALVTSDAKSQIETGRGFPRDGKSPKILVAQGSVKNA